MTDIRPRVKYVWPDGRVALVIVPRGERARPYIALPVAESDPLWPTAQHEPGTTQRFTLLSLAQGL